MVSQIGLMVYLYGRKAKSTPINEILIFPDLPSEVRAASSVLCYTLGFYFMPLIRCRLIFIFATC